MKIIRVFIDAFFYWRRNSAMDRAAALSFYTLSSLAPTLLIAVSIGRALINPALITGELERQAAATLGGENARLLVDLALTEFDSQTSIFTFILSLFLLFFGATGLFKHLKNSLNAYLQMDQTDSGGEKKPGIGVRLARAVINEVIVRFIAVFMVILAAITIVLSLVLFTFLYRVGQNIGDNFSFNPGFYRLANTIVSFVLFTFIFSVVFQAIPRKKFNRRSVVMGAAIGSLLFNFLHYLFGLYLSVATVGSAYGAAGSLVVFLLWMYYSAQSMYFGAGVMAVLEGE